MDKREFLISLRSDAALTDDVVSSTDKRTPLENSPD